jgi:membrane fusion protein (multidrug efflux system)
MTDIHQTSRPAHPRAPRLLASPPIRQAALALMLGLALASCGREQAAGGKTAAPPAPPPPEVTVMTVTPQSTTLFTEIVTEVKALREVELRPRASGIVTRIGFAPGQPVKAGDLLFVLDPRPYDEAIASAQANLAEAQANLARVRQDVERYAPLLKDNAIPRQTYEQTVAQERQVKAVVDARQAGLESARLERSYTEVRSPMAGLVGLQKVEVGGLASAGQTVLVTVSTRDPMVAYFNIPETDYLAVMRGSAGAPANRDNALRRPVRLVLADGSVYGQPGRIDFADRALDAGTGTLTLRAVFPNPGDVLRAGMSARVRIPHDTLENALLVPQKAVGEMLGRQFLTVVGEGDKVEQRAVTLGARSGENWLVTAGLKPGERIVVDGLQAARPGTVVAPRALVPLKAPEPAAAPGKPAPPAAATPAAAR